MDEHSKKVLSRRNLCIERINQIEGLDVQNPGGAFYMFIKLTHPKWTHDDKSFVLDLLHQEHVLLVHGSGFSPEFGAGHVRLVYLASEEALHEAFDRIERFSKTHKQRLLDVCLGSQMFMSRWWGLFLGLLLIPSVSAETGIIQPSEMTFDLFTPLIVAIIAAIFLRAWMVPNQLSSLQVGFEIDDNLYEVHRLTEDRQDAKELLGMPGIKISLMLYMMAMLSVLLLIAELMFKPTQYFYYNVILMGALFIIPVVISPWESLNTQISGKKISAGGFKFTGILKRLMRF